MNKKDIAAESASLLVEAKAILFSPDDPFTFTSGMRSPVYTDMRKIIAFPRIRSRLIDLAISTIEREVGSRAFDVISGGETAGIPFAAWMADRLHLPMQYVRKKPKGFGRNAQIEGQIVEGARTLLVEDLATDGGSKINFVEANRRAGQTCDDVFVFFFYGIYPQALATMTTLGVRLHHLVTWHDVIAVARKLDYLPAPKLEIIEAFLAAPTEWSRAHGGQGDVEAEGAA